MSDHSNYGKTPDAPKRDVEGNLVNVVEKDIKRSNPKTDGVDKVITPTNIKTREQEAQEINERSAEVERRLGR
jgi:hypothetical protein